ncbi:MAG: aspartate-semialdehyde dehydrogenase [Holosporales bacterium]|jgi:aspartate-semialdehyde dehydrogenase|nr:aspartate-semialdehyde dehydrogenase [Holosporales bacterium]
MNKKYRVAVIGATGNVGKSLLEILYQRQFPISQLTVFASPRSKGQTVAFGAQSLPLETLEVTDFSTFDLAFFCAGAQVSRDYVPQATRAGCIVIDKSSAFRDHSAVPLIVPEVNGSLLNDGLPLGIVANPNCVAIPLSMTLAPLRSLGLKRVVVSTYQSVSGAGRSLCSALRQQSVNLLSEEAMEGTPEDIGFNVLPFIGAQESDGFSEEETKIMQETQKIMQCSFGLCVTSVRVPVFIGHGFSVAVAWEQPCSLEDVRQRFQQAEGLRWEEDVLATPRSVAGTDTVIVNRLRRDPSVPQGAVFWGVADNLRKGAATNGVQIAEKLLQIDPTLASFQKRFS